MPSPRSRILSLIAPLALLVGCGPDNKFSTFNAEPEVEILTPADGSTVLAGTTLALLGSASDADDAHADLTARWFVNDAEACDSAAPASDGTTTCAITVPDTDALSIRLQATDLRGAAGVDHVDLVVTPNEAPTATIVSPTTEGLYYSDTLILYSGVVADADEDEDALTVWWEDGATRLDDVEAQPTSSGVVLGYSTLAEGPHAIELHALDGAGNEGVATVLIEVGPPNSAPSCGITEPADSTVGREGQAVTFRGTVADADLASDLLVATWTSDKDGPLGSSAPTSGGTVTFPFSGLTLNSHVISLHVVDEVGATCTAEVLYTVGSPPTIALDLPLSDEAVNEGESLTFSALVSDGEDAPAALTVMWESDVDGVFHEAPPDSGGVAQFLDDALSRGDHALTVTVTDSDGLTSTALGTFTVNGLPSAPGVSLSPASPSTDDDVRVSVDSPSVDPEGDALTLAYVWLLDGLASTASTSATVPASATTRGDVWTVEVTATDGLGTSPAGLASVTIRNTAPTAPGVEITPADAEDSDDLTCAVTTASTDADGDVLTYSFRWDVDGVEYTSATDSATTSSVSGADVAGGQLWTCEVEAGDGTDVGTGTADVLVVESACDSALSFDGVDDAASFSNVSGLGSGFTFEAWMRGTPTSSHGPLLSTNCGGLFWTASGLWAEIYPDCSGTITRYTNYESELAVAWPTDWFHLSVVVTTATVTVYVNGTSVGSDTLFVDGGVSGTYGSGIGARFERGSPSSFWTQVDFADVLLNAGSSRSGAFTPSYPLVATGDTHLHYDFTEGAGSTLNDAVGTRDGTILGATWVEACLP
ncbi:MAG: hypothetical protein EXR69_00725 [Myxococcales bacterium]|nr:hypothetical protein [Myxococcales bacterium]